MSDTIILPSAVFSDTHSPKMSAKYTHIKTSDILERFFDMGWQVSSANAPRHSKNPEHARHAVRLRHRDFPMLDKDNVIPELIVLNSHNGQWALRMALGMFRLVCSNGMVAGNLWAGVGLKHYNLKNLEEKITEVTGEVGQLGQKLETSIRHWSEVEVPLKEQMDFAEKALAIRWKGHHPLSAEQLLESRRPQDMGSDLWRVFNRVQENLTQGGMTGVTSNSRTLNIKAVRNVKRDFLFNSQLWNLAAEYAKEAA